MRKQIEMLEASAFLKPRLTRNCAMAAVEVVETAGRRNMIRKTCSTRRLTRNLASTGAEHLSA